MCVFPPFSFFLLIFDFFGRQSKGGRLCWLQSSYCLRESCCGKSVYFGSLLDGKRDRTSHLLLESKTTTGPSSPCMSWLFGFLQIPLLNNRRPPLLGKSLKDTQKLKQHANQHPLEGVIFGGFLIHKNWNALINAFQTPKHNHRQLLILG